MKKILANARGQGTTEYLIILAVIIVVALVVAGIMGFFPGLGTGISESQSRAYWQSTTPLAITQYEVDSAGASFVVRNQTTDKIEAEEISLDGVAVIITDANVSAGAQSTFTGVGVTCTSGETYQYNVVITYSVDNGLQNARLTGTKPLIGQCP